MKRGKLAVTVLGDRVIGPRKNGVTSTRKPLPRFTLMEFKSTVTAESLAIVPLKVSTCPGNAGRVWGVRVMVSDAAHDGAAQRRRARSRSNLYIFILRSFQGTTYGIITRPALVNEPPE